MTMLLINGSFQITGTQPDGDTFHFTSNDPTEWALVGSGGRAVKHDVLGRAMLRLAPSGAVPRGRQRYRRSTSTPDLLRTTANHHLIATGYRSLFPSLRAELTAAVRQARTAPAQGLWPSDTTTGVSSLTDATRRDVVILPKLALPQTASPTLSSP